VDNVASAPLFFDWNPGDEVRPYNKLGPIYLQIEESEVLFHFQKDGNEYNCQVDLPAESARTYQIEFGPNWEVILYVGDEEFNEECRAYIDEPDQLFGRITFSGFGLVNRITITFP
jgi:hypothetical protein